MYKKMRFSAISDVEFGEVRKQVYFCNPKVNRCMNEKGYPYIEEEPMAVAEPAVAAWSESVSGSGLLGQVMKLSRPDKVALIKYLKKDVEAEEPFHTDDFGRIILTKKMREAVAKAEHSYEQSECLSEETFKQRFAKWL